MKDIKDDFVIHKIFAQISSRFSDRVCLQIKKGPAWERWTYGQIEDFSLRIGAFLIKEGFKKGDFACLCLENRPEWAIIYLGIMAAGMSCVPLDPQLTEQEIENCINDCTAKIIFVSNVIFQKKNINKSKAGLKKVVILDLDVEQDRLCGLAQVKLSSPEGVVWPEVVPEDVASLIYTSGTTASPKGVMLTHKNFCSNFKSINKLKLFSDKDIFISILPLHHAYPFMVTLITPLFCRSRVTYPTSLRSDELLNLMRETGVTVLVGVPQLFSIFYSNISEKMKKIPFFFRVPLVGLTEILWQIRNFSGINLSKLALPKIHRSFGHALRFFACGGAKLNEETGQFLMKIGFTILEGYGLTETSPVVTFNPLKRQKIGSVGTVVPDVELKIDNPDVAGMGEVVIKGPNVMKGYYNRADETSSVLKDGWFYSGDLGTIDKDGYLTITGRKKEVIVLSSGKNIYPEEVEAHYVQSPYIKEICVLGVGSVEEERLAAVVVPDADYCRKVGLVDFNSTIRWELENLSERLAPYQRIKGYVVTKDDLSRTRLGKIKRYEVRKKYLDELTGVKLKGTFREIPAAEEDIKLLSSDTGSKIIEVLKKSAKIERQIHPSDHIELDLGIDSLGRVELIIALEQAFSLRIPNELMTRVFTVKELIVEIEKLVLDEGVPKDLLVQVKSQALWNDILNEKPTQDVIRKINLSPNAMTTLGMWFFAEILRLVFRAIWGLKVFGTENIPRIGKCILCVNHTSYLDAFIVEASVPMSLQKSIFFVGFRAYFEQPIIKNIVKYIRVIPIDPGMHFVEAMQASSYVLKNGKIVCIFPEGQRSIDGNIKDFKKGVGILAKELNVPLVPVLITGAYESWPRTNSFPRPHPIEITFGRPFDFDELKAEGSKRGAKDEYEAIALGIKEEVIKLDKRGAMKTQGPETSILKVANGTLTTIDHQEISFQHFKNGGRAVIIIAHGYYSSKQAVLLQQLAKALGGEYDILMFDFRGHGKSSGLFTWTSREGNDLRAVLDFVAPQYSKIGLIAFSMGASISINVLAHDKRVNSLICVSAPSDMARIDYRFWTLDWKGDAVYTFFNAKGRTGTGVRPGPFWLAKERPIDNVGKITIPIMFIHGSRDWVIRPWHSDALFQKAGGMKKIISIKNGPHAEYSMRDYPEQFVTEVKNWFRDTL